MGRDDVWGNQRLMNGDDVHDFCMYNNKLIWVVYISGLSEKST